LYLLINIYMKKIYQTLLDFPGMVNQKIMNAELNTAVSNFDSQGGIRSYTASIYQLLSLLVLLSMEIAIIMGAMDFMGSDASGLAKAGSMLTTVLMMYSAFPIAHIIRSRGESLGASHNGMVGFMFKDFVTTNLLMLGEIAAVSGFICATCFSLSFLFDSDLYCVCMNSSMLGVVGWVTTLPMDGLNALLAALRLDYLSGVIANVTAFRLNDAATFNGDMLWNRHDLLLVGGAYVNVMLGLAVVYVNLAIYNYMFGLVDSLSKWIQSPTLPVSMKSK